MSTAEIEQAIESLPASAYAELLAWLDDRRASQADARFEDAALSGKFDALAQRAEHDIDAGQTLPLEDFLRERN